MLIVDNLEFAFSPTQKWNFSFAVPAGKSLAIIGESGSGKSTLLNLIAGFYTPSAGSIIFDQKILTHLSPAQRPVSMLFQENNLFEHLTVAQNIALGIHPGLKLSATEWQQVAEMIKKIGLHKKNDQLPSNLSGGQRQRVALARCLLRNKPLLLLDEPFTALDMKTKFELLSLVKDFQQSQNITLLLVSHQEDETTALTENFIELSSEGIYSGKF
jgi:thiamine transport system ATP-binding protein